MRTAIRTAVVLGMFAVAAAAVAEDRAPAPASRPATTQAGPVAKIQRHRFDPQNGGNGRTWFVLNGEGFDPNADKDKSFCQTSRDNRQTWADCKAIETCNGSYYKAESTYSAANKVVWVRVKGTDGNWSDPKILDR